MRTSFERKFWPTVLLKTFGRKVFTELRLLGFDSESGWGGLVGLGTGTASRA